MKLSIIVPAYNEELRIGRMLDMYMPAFTGLYGHDVEFLIIVNGSDDNTEHIVRQYGKKYPQIKVLVEEDNIGKGGAVMIGMAVAHGEYIGFVDADGATPPDAFQDLLDAGGDADVVIASRWMRGSEITVKQTHRRRLASRCFNLLVRVLFGLKLTDTQCGAKIIKKEAAKEVLPHLGITQWAFDVDLLFQIRRAGYSIKEIPTKWKDVENSRLEIGRASIDMFFALIRLRLAYSPFKWMIKYYNPKIFPFVSRHTHVGMVVDNKRDES